MVKLDKVENKKKDNEKSKKKDLKSYKNVYLYRSKKN